MSVVERMAGGNRAARAAATALALCVVQAGAAAVEDEAPAHLRLRAQVTICGPRPTLGDVLSFADAPAELNEQLADQPLVRGKEHPQRLIISHDQVVQRLEELGVNMAQVVVSGALRCDVAVETPAPKPAPRGAADGVALLRAPRPNENTTDREPAALGDVLRRRINAEVESLGGTAEIEFERSGADFLELTTPPWEFTITSSSRDKLGLREFRVVVRRDGKTQRTVSLAAQVRLARRVVVARRPIGVGTLIKADDLTLETRVLAAGADLGLDQLEPLVGQAARRLIPTGEILRKADVKAVDLVQRSRPVTVSSRGGGVQLQLTGVALDSGTYGDIVRVRVGESRKQTRELRCAVTGVGAVRMLEDGE